MSTYALPGSVLSSSLHDLSQCSHCPVSSAVVISHGVIALQRQGVRLAPRCIPSAYDGAPSASTECVNASSNKGETEVRLPGEAISTTGPPESLQPQVA